MWCVWHPNRRATTAVGLCDECANEADDEREHEALDDELQRRHDAAVDAREDELFER